MELKGICSGIAQIFWVFYYKQQTRNLQEEKALKKIVSSFELPRSKPGEPTILEFTLYRDISSYFFSYIFNLSDISLIMDDSTENEASLYKTLFFRINVQHGYTKPWICCNLYFDLCSECPQLENPSCFFCIILFFLDKGTFNISDYLIGWLSTGIEYHIIICRVIPIFTVY